MMREILFRGKAVGSLKWVDGFYFREAGNFIKELPSAVSTETHMVYEDTVGQYTGLTDKNGKKIFEGDIVLFPWGEKREVFSVEFVEGEFEAIPKRKSTDIWCIRIGSYAPEFEVIGNIHDNPELLKGGER